MSARAAARLETLGFQRVYRYTAGKQDWTASGLPTEGELSRLPRVRAVARQDVPTCRPRERVGAVRARLDGGTWEGCVVVDERNVVLGLLHRDTLVPAEADRPVEELMDPGPLTYRPDTLATQLVHHMAGHGQERPRTIERVLVTTADGELVGIVRRADAERTLAEASADDERAAGAWSSSSQRAPCP